MVHRREIEGTEVVLGNQGALWGHAMTWWDHETGSVWSQPLGEAIAGPLKGSKLELVASSLTTWGAWRQEHPDGLVLNAPGGRSGFDLGRMAVAVTFADETAAYSISGLREFGPKNDVLVGVPIVVLIDPTDLNRWAVFSRRLDDITVTLARDGLRIIDLETGTTWDPNRGIGSDGPLEGEILDLLPGFTVFPNDFRTFWPDGVLWPGS